MAQAHAFSTEGSRNTLWRCIQQSGAHAPQHWCPHGPGMSSPTSMQLQEPAQEGNGWRVSNFHFLYPQVSFLCNGPQSTPGHARLSACLLGGPQLQPSCSSPRLGTSLWFHLLHQDLPDPLPSGRSSPKAVWEALACIWFSAPRSATGLPSVSS